MANLEDIVPAGASTADYLAIVNAWSPEERIAREKKLMRKIDFRLLPILVSIVIKIYSCYLPDITNSLHPRSSCTL